MITAENRKKSIIGGKRVLAILKITNRLSRSMRMMRVTVTLLMCVAEAVGRKIGLITPREELKLVQVGPDGTRAHGRHKVGWGCI